jgi:hypothetical protein
MVAEFLFPVTAEAHVLFKINCSYFSFTSAGLIWINLNGGGWGAETHNFLKLNGGSFAFT